MLYKEDDPTTRKDQIEKAAQEEFETSMQNYWKALDIPQPYHVNVSGIST